MAPYRDPGGNMLMFLPAVRAKDGQDQERNPAIILATAPPKKHGFQLLARLKRDVDTCPLVLQDGPAAYDSMRKVCDQRRAVHEAALVLGGRLV